MLAGWRNRDLRDPALLAAISGTDQLRDARVIRGDPREEAVDIEPGVGAIALLDLGQREPAVRVRLVRHELDDDLQLVQGKCKVSGAERRDPAIQVDLRGGLGVVGAGGASHEEDRDDRGDPRLHPVAQ